MTSGLRLVFILTDSSSWNRAVQMFSAPSCCMKVDLKRHSGELPWRIFHKHPMSWTSSVKPGDVIEHCHVQKRPQVSAWFPPAGCYSFKAELDSIFNVRMSHKHKGRDHLERRWSARLLAAWIPPGDPPDSPQLSAAGTEAGPYVSAASALLSTESCCMAS